MLCPSRLYKILDFLKLESYEKEKIGVQQKTHAAKGKN